MQMYVCAHEDFINQREPRYKYKTEDKIPSLGVSDAWRHF